MPPPTLPHYPLSWRSWRFRGVVAMVLLVLAIRLIWGASVSSRLREQIVQIRQRGQPAILSDLKVESLDDAHNAWTLKTKAENAVSQSAATYSPRNGNAIYRRYPPYPAGWMSAAAASEKANAKAFALLRRMRGLDRGHSRAKWTSPAYIWPFPSYNNARLLANTAADSALFSHVHGDDFEAIERVRDVLHLADILRQEPIIVGQLVAIGVESLAYNDVFVIAPGLRFKQSEGVHPAAREQIQTLIAQLLDDQAARQSFRFSWIAERVMTCDYVDWSAGNNWFIHPFADLEMRRFNRIMDQLIEASAQPDWPAVEKSLKGFDPELPVGMSVPSTLSGAAQPFLPQYSRWYEYPIGGVPTRQAIETAFRASAERRMSAVSLAAQLYRDDHGRWPARLEELVPAYLPALPIDPFEPDGRPLGYVVARGVLPEGGDRPVVFSEAPGARAEPLLNTPMYDFEGSAILPHVHFIRQYRDLARFERITSGKGVYYDPNKPREPGN